MRFLVAVMLLFAVAGSAQSSIYGPSNSSGGLYGPTAAPAYPAYDVGGGTSTQPTVLAAAQKKRAGNVCLKDYRDCLALCKKGSPSNRPICEDICYGNYQWCGICGGRPC